MSVERPKAIIELFHHIERGEQAIELLESIWLNSPSSYNIVVTPEQQQKIRDFFGFDDSE